MAIGAIIAEYNPFHKGHRYHLEQTKEQCQDGVVVILSGNFVQRGEGAILPKSLRTAVALKGGADLVIELPLPYATATAERFAFGGVYLADALGCVDLLSMGSELGEIAPLVATAQALEGLSPTAYMQKGTTFAAARQLAMEQQYPALAPLLSSPNNILAIAYCQALQRLSSPIKPITIQRKGIGHDQPLQVGEFASGSALRTLWREEGFSSLIPYLPEESIGLYRGEIPFQDQLFWQMAMPTLRSLTLEEIRQLPDLSEGLEHKVYQAFGEGSRYEEILSLLKSKRYTLARMRRILLSAVLGVRREDLLTPPPYIRILGIGEKGEGILKRVKTTAKLPFSHSLSRLSRENATAERFAYLESRSSDLYHLASSPVKPRGEDYRLPLITPYKEKR